MSLYKEDTMMETNLNVDQGNRLFQLNVDSRKIVADLKGVFLNSYLYTLVGSANRIVCVAVDDLESSMYLWNPAIRECKLIPDFIKFGGPFGFGYDRVDDDYKVISTTGYPFDVSVGVYSVKRNVWRKLPEPIEEPHFDVCVNGFFYGIGRNGMMTFDLNKELFNHSIKLPIIDYDYGNDVTRIIEFNNSIAVIQVWAHGLNGDVAVEGLKKKINIWTLDGDACLRVGGGEVSWTLMFSIDLAMPRYLIFGYFSNNNLLLSIRTPSITENDCVWILCDAHKKEAKLIPPSIIMPDHHCIQNVFKYSESLVSLPGFKQVNWNAGEDTS